MKDQRNFIKAIEIFLLSFVWLVLLATPILFREENNRPLLDSVLKQFEILLPLSVLFFINRFWFVPRFLYHHRYGRYIGSVVLTILILTSALFVYHEKQTAIPPTGIAGIENDRRPPPGEGHENKPVNVDRQGQPSKPAPPYANFLILSLLITGFDTGLRSTLRWTLAEKDKFRLEKENVATQLVLLRNQISPHFFMNTLNNIHALVDINAEEAKHALIRLSRMMRYLLYETETEQTSLASEVEFISSYVDLMKLRFTEKVRIQLQLPSVIPDKTIPPFLFISLIENAFKHGISYREESYIDIDLSAGENRLVLVVKNSKSGTVSETEKSGIGIENTRKRLDLLYGSSYHLDIIDNKDSFIVNLSVPI